MADDFESGALSETVDRADLQLQDLTRTANGFARAMSSAFSQSVTGAKGFDDILKSLALRMSSLALQAAIKPLTSSIAEGFSSLFGGLFGGGTPNVTAALGAVKPFADGGVIGAPTYFPLSQGGLGLAGEAGPEAIMPLTRGPDGRLGVAGRGSGAASITVNISTPDADSFRRSEVYVTGQIARAVERGQRGM
jgi:phage-related minor tail protein